MIWFSKNEQNSIPHDLFKIFNNVDTIKILAGDYYHHYPFSLLLLLSTIKHTSINKVIIGIGLNEYSDIPLFKLDKVKTEYGKNEIDLKVEPIYRHESATSALNNDIIERPGEF